MALTTYDGLIETIRDYIARPDAPAAVFVEQAHSDLRGVRHRYMEKSIRLSAAAHSEGATLPDDFLEIRSLKLDCLPLKPVSMHKATDSHVGSAPGYFITGNTLALNPRPAASMKLNLIYFAKLPPLNAENPSNWLLEHFPLVYLHASLVHAYEWLRDEQAETASRSRLAEAISMLNRDSRRGAYGGNTPGAIT